MKGQWEYQVLQLNSPSWAEIEERLNAHGINGWKLQAVSVSGVDAVRLYLEREVTTRVGPARGEKL